MCGTEQAKAWHYWYPKKVVDVEHIDANYFASTSCKCDLLWSTEILILTLDGWNWITSYIHQFYCFVYYNMSFYAYTLPLNHLRSAFSNISLKEKVVYVVGYNTDRITIFRCQSFICGRWAAIRGHGSKSFIDIWLCSYMKLSHFLYDEHISCAIAFRQTKGRDGERERERERGERERDQN